MSKLLTAPRIPKEITAPIKKRYVKKVSEEPKADVKYTLLSEDDTGKVDALFELYKKDRFKARVKYFSNATDFKYNRLVIFERGNDFEIVEMQNTFGISVTNRIYSSQKKMRSIIFKKGKFYYINKLKNVNVIKPLTAATLLKFISETENGFYHAKHVDLKNNSKVYQFLYEKFKWIQMLMETEAARGIAFNTVLSKELFSQKDVLRHIFKVPINIINIVLAKVSSSYKDIDDDERLFMRNSNRPSNAFESLRQWKEVSKVLDGVQNLTSEFYHSYLFADTCSMALKLGRRINCNWGIKRLREAHDDWAKDIRNILLDCDLEYRLKIQPAYFAFAKYSGYKLLFTNKEMLVEGVRQNHCVGSYIDKVQRGECAIFHVDGFTLQVKIEKSVLAASNGFVKISENNGQTLNLIQNTEEMTKALLFKEFTDRFGSNVEPKNMYMMRNIQFRGLRNSTPPPELVDKVNKLLFDYSFTQEFQDLMEKKVTLDPEVIAEIDKTRWEVVINHELGKYEIKQDVVAVEIPTQEELKATRPRRALVERALEDALPF